MAGEGALLAEVAWRADEALAEMILPQTIDHDPGRQRVGGVSDPLRQGQAPLLVVGRRVAQRKPRRDNAQHAGFDDLAFLHRVASVETVSWFGLLDEFAGIDHGNG